MGNDTAKDLAQKALQANKNHQYALKIYTERLEAELESLDKLLVSYGFTNYIETQSQKLDV